MDVFKCRLGFLMDMTIGNTLQKGNSVKIGGSQYTVQKIEKKRHKESSANCYQCVSKDMSFFVKHYNGIMDEDNRWSHEIDIQGALGDNNPHILNLIDADRKGDQSYLVFPWLNGSSLDKLNRNISLGIANYWNLLPSVLDGLTYVHSKEIVHRDIKPANIFLHAEGDLEEAIGNRTCTPVITDFELAIRIQDLEEEEDEDSTSGTPVYMVPEQVLAPKTIDQRTDIYSLGISSYEMLTGIRPFRSYSIENVLSRILFWEAINMRMLVPTIPKEISEIAHKMMEKGPKDRYQSAEELKKIVCEQIEVI